MYSNSLWDRNLASCVFSFSIQEGYLLYGISITDNSYKTAPMVLIKLLFHDHAPNALLHKSNHLDLPKQLHSKSNTMSMKTHPFVQETLYDLGFSFFSFHKADRPTPETLTTLNRTPGISPFAFPLRPKPARSTSSFSSTKLRQPSLGTVEDLN